MGEVSAAAAVAAAAPALEGVLQRRIEFHLARKPQAAAAVGGGGFRMETLNPDAAVSASAAPRSEGEARRLEKGEASGLDPELSVARIYLGRIGAGLNNLGNTCYLNSVLQCLTYTEPFAAYLQSGRHKSSCRTTGFCALCALQNHVKTALQSTGKIVTPLQIVRNLSCISRRFCKSRQEDAHELMVNLLESMHKCCLPSDVPIESPSAYEKSLVHRIFGGRLRSQVKCTRCLHCSNKFDPFLDLSLDIAKASTLLRALKNFTEEEVLDGGEKQYQCERCRQKVVAKKRFTIDKAPNVLTVHLKRFSPFNPRVKIDKNVDFPPVLDLKPFISDSKGTDCTYSLYGVLVHCGVNTQGGHYYCFVRTSSGMWHNLDDNQVRQVRESDVLKQQAYMLFYVRDRVGNTMVRKGTSAGIMPGKKMTTEKISCLNGVIQSGVAEAKLNGPSPPYVDKKLQSISIGHSGVINKTSPDHLSKNDCKTEAVVVSQNNGLSSAHKALVPRNDGATLPFKSKQIAMSCLNELSSSSQSASLIDTSSDHTLAETPLPEPKTDGAFTKLGNSTFAASPVVSSLARSSQADQISQSQTTISSKTISNAINMDAGVTAQTFVTKDAVVSNGDVPSNGSSTPVEEMKDSMASLDKTVKELPINKLDVGKEICPEVSMNVVAASSCNGSVAKKVVLKSKKLVRYPVVNLWLGPRQLLLGSLKSQKKRKHKRAKKMSAACKNVTNIDYSGHNISEQQTSTSAAVPTENVECTPHGQKRDYASAFSENDTLMLKKKQQIVGAGAGDHILDKRNSKCATFGSDSDLIKSDPSSSVNQAHLRNNGDAKLGAFQPISILTRDLKEGAVPCWDNVAIPNIEAKESNHSKSKSIGYVLDEWDEEYDRGRVKKVRKLKEDYGGPNPFQEETNFISQQRMKQSLPRQILEQANQAR